MKRMLRELGENSEWDKDCLDKESIEFIEKNKIKWNCVVVKRIRF